jgi:flagellar basal body rod protein FlgC
MPRNVLKALTIVVVALAPGCSGRSPLVIHGVSADPEMAECLRCHGVRPLEAAAADDMRLQAGVETRAALKEYLAFLGRRLRAIERNIAEADVIADSYGRNRPYRRMVVVWDGSSHGSVQEDSTPLPIRYDPGHPLADSTGYVRLTNVDLSVERALHAAVFREYGSVRAALDE